MVSIPELGRSLGEGNGYPLQYSCLENSMDRGAWGATVHARAMTRSLCYTHEALTSLGQQKRKPEFPVVTQESRHNSRKTPGKCSVPRPGSPVPSTPERREGLRACYWECPPPWDLPDPEIEPTSSASPALQADSLPTGPPGKLFRLLVTALCLKLTLISSG